MIGIRKTRRNGEERGTGKGLLADDGEIGEERKTDQEENAKEKQSKKSAANAAVKEVAAPTGAAKPMAEMHNMMAEMRSMITEVRSKLDSVVLRKAKEMQELLPPRLHPPAVKESFLT